MTRAGHDVVKDARELLAAAVHIPLRDAESVDRLAQRFARRLVSRGGRPTDPSWTITRRVPFSEDTWSLLHDLAERLASDDRTVSPAQLAASMVEDQAAELDRAIHALDARRRAQQRSGNSDD